MAVDYSGLIGTINQGAQQDQQQFANQLAIRSSQRQNALADIQSQREVRVETDAREKEARAALGKLGDSMARIAERDRPTVWAQNRDYLSTMLDPKIVSQIDSSPNAWSNDGVGVMQRLFGAGTIEDRLGDMGKEAVAKHAVDGFTAGPDGLPRQYVRSGDQPMPVAIADPNSASTNATARRGQDITAHGQNLTDSRARETAAIAREQLGKPMAGEDENGPGFFSFDRNTGKIFRISGLNPAGTMDKNNIKAGAKMAIANQIAVIDKASGHPGRETATGASGTWDPRNYLPGTDATNFRSVIDQLNGAAFMQAYQSLRGGGQITEIEGAKATNAITNLNRAQSDAQFLEALQSLRDVMTTGYKRLTGEAYPEAGKPVPIMTDARNSSPIRDPKSPSQTIIWARDANGKPVKVGR